MIHHNRHVARRAETSTILVVEDDAVTREFYRIVLTGEGYAVIAVRDGIDALRVLEQHQPAAVILDLGLPGLPGTDVAEEMFAQPTLNSVPIIIVTGDARGIDPKHFACVLHKPVDPLKLIDAVTNCISHAH